jgi:hypothetical protein
VPEGKVVTFADLGRTETTRHSKSGKELRSEPEMKTGRWGTPGNYASDSASAAANAPSAKPLAYSQVT